MRHSGALSHSLETGLSRSPRNSQDTSVRSMWQRLKNTLQIRNSARVGIAPRTPSWRGSAFSTPRTRMPRACSPQCHENFKLVDEEHLMSLEYPQPSDRNPNYTSHACALVDAHYVEDAIEHAREVIEDLLDSEDGRNFVELQARVMRAWRKGAIQIQLHRHDCEEAWGVLFRKSRQLQALGWSSDQYVVVQKLKRDIVDGTASPGMRAGLTIGDVVVRVNGLKITDYRDFLSQVKSSKKVTVLVVRPKTTLLLSNQACEESNNLQRDLQRAKQYLTQRVLSQARKNAQASLSRMRRLDSRERIAVLDSCV